MPKLKYSGSVPKFPIEVSSKRVGRNIPDFKTKEIIDEALGMEVQYFFKSIFSIMASYERGVDNPILKSWEGVFDNSFAGYETVYNRLEFQYVIYWSNPFLSPDLAQFFQNHVLEGKFSKDFSKVSDPWLERRAMATIREAFRGFIDDDE